MIPWDKACESCGAAVGVDCKLTEQEFAAAGSPPEGANGRHGVVHESRHRAAAVDTFDRSASDMGWAGEVPR